MESFVFYDIIFLIIFVLVSAVFLYSRKHNLKREGLLYLYRTKIGIKIIDYTSKKFEKFLKPAQYAVIASGYALMAVMLYTLFKFAYAYVTSPDLIRAVKMPVIMPLIPYLPELFKIDFLPPFYFTYWIIIIAIIAIPHEFAHGIFARLNKIKVHSTGFGFLGPFLAAFVEPDEKQTNKSSKFTQLSILSSGTFANVLTAILFGLILWGFFVSAFSPAGVNFQTYSYNILNVSEISYSQASLASNSSLVPIFSGNETYFTTTEVLKNTIKNNLTLIPAYEDSPALNASLSGAITEIDGEKITSIAELSNAVYTHSPGDRIQIKTINSSKDETLYSISLSEKGGKAFLGIGLLPLQERSGILGKVYSMISNIKSPYLYYQSSLGDLGIFIYDLLWWIVLICISVALVNMLPLGIFDGGRFFFLSVWGATGSRKIGEYAFKFSTWFILGIIVLMMVTWFLAIF